MTSMTMTQNQTQTQIHINASVVEDMHSVCEKPPKKNKSVRFAEDTRTYYYDRRQETTTVMQGEDCPTKTYDGMELAKQVTECLVYTFFTKKIVSFGRMIHPILNDKFGNLDKVVTDRVVELLTNAHERVKQLPVCSKNSGKAPLFQDTSGKYGLGFLKVHQVALSLLVNLCGLSFQQNTN
jgi:hypothetical protein